MTEKTDRFQQKLEEKQAANLQSIKERESQVRIMFRVRAVPWHKKSKPQRINLDGRSQPTHSQGVRKWMREPTQTPEGQTAHPRAPALSA